MDFYSVPFTGTRRSRARDQGASRAVSGPMTNIDIDLLPRPQSPALPPWELYGAPLDLYVR